MMPMGQTEALAEWRAQISTARRSNRVVYFVSLRTARQDLFVNQANERSRVLKSN